MSIPRLSQLDIGRSPRRIRPLADWTNDTSFSQLGVGRWALDVGRFFFFSALIATRSLIAQSLETWRWLRLVHRVPMLAPRKVEQLLAETKALAMIFSASIRTADRNKE